MIGQGAGEPPASRCGDPTIIKLNPEQILHEARMLPPSEQAAYLKGACTDDVGLRSKVEGLLRADAEAGSFMEAIDTFWAEWAVAGERLILPGVPGDVNADGLVNAEDLRLMLAGMEGRPGANSPDGLASLNGDGRVDGRDLARVTGNGGSAPRIDSCRRNFRKRAHAHGRMRITDSAGYEQVLPLPYADADGDGQPERSWPLAYTRATGGANDQVGVEHR